MTYFRSFDLSSSSLGARYVIASAALLASSVASAQDSQQLDEPAIQDIIVTAQKRETSLQDTPLAVTAIGADTVERARLFAAGDLAKLVPNLQFREAASTAERNFVIRGVGTGTSSVGVEGSVGVVVDNVVLGREGAGVSGFADIERIEVLRGPQGTLFGKNASAGVISIFTRKPSLTEFNGQLQSSFGNSDAYRLSGYVNGPVSQHVGLHLSGFAEGSDGFSRSVINGKSVNGPEQIGGRFKVLYQPNDDVELLLSSDLSRSIGHCCQWSLDKVVQGTLHDVLVRATGLAEIGPNSRQTFFEITPQDNSRQGGGSAELNWALGSHSLTSITAYRKWHQNDLINPDFLPGIIQILNFTKNSRNQRQLSQEFRIASPSGGPISYVVGLYYLKQRIGLENDRRGFGLYGVTPQNTVVTIVPQNPNLGSFTRAHDSTASYAAFADGNFTLATRLSGLIGVRYSYETKSVDFNRSPSPGTLAVHPGFPAGSFGISDLADRAFTYRAGLQYEWSDQVMSYVTYSTGHKGKGVDLNAGLALSAGGQPVPASAHAVKAEDVRNLEAGIRSSFWGRRLQLNLTGFLSTIRNYQGTAFVPEAVVFALQSVPKIRSDGVEFEAALSLTRFLRFTGNASYLRSRYADFTKAPCFVLQTAALGCVGGVQNLTGVQVPRAPDFSFNLGLSYDPPISSSLSAMISANYSWQDSISLGIDNDPNVRTSGYGLLDLSVGLRTANRRAEVTLWAKNVADKNYPTFLSAQLGGAGNYFHYLGTPATYGVGATWRF